MESSDSNDSSIEEEEQNEECALCSATFPSLLEKKYKSISEVESELEYQRKKKLKLPL